MKKEKFTQGEWKVMNQTGRLDYSYMVYTGDECDRTNEGESKANAHLIAAAPKMYRMLTMLSMYVGGFDDGGVNSKSCEQVSGDIQKLLAKARGEQNG